MVRLFLVFTYIWQEDVAIIPKVPEVPRNIIPAPNNMVSKRSHQYIVPFFNNNIHLHLASFLLKLSSGLLFTAKILHEAVELTSSYLGQITYKI